MVSSVKQASFRFYAELNELLPPVRRATSFPHRFSGRQSVSRLIDDLGVPESRVHLVLVNGCPADLSHYVEDGDRVAVYPDFRSLDLSPGG